MEHLAALAQRAESGGLDLVVVRAGGEAPGLDPWTVAVWLAGKTERIQIGVASPAAVPDPTDPEAPYPAVVEKAQQSLERLAGARLVTSGSAWVTAPPDAEPAALRDLAEAGLPVVIPVHSMGDVDRLVALVADENGGTRPRRPAAARARRRPGIDYDGVPESVAGTAIEPGDPQYHSVASTYLRGGSPGLVLRPHTPQQVADAWLRLVATGTFRWASAAAGTASVARSTNRGGLVIDVSRMNSIEILRPGPPARAHRPGRHVETGRGRARPVRLGARLGRLRRGRGRRLATAGGIGFLPQVRVDHRPPSRGRAGARRRKAGAGQWDEHPDLFWAVRGAGANFGVATAFEFEVNELDEIGYAQFIWSARTSRRRCAATVTSPARRLGTRPRSSSPDGLAPANP